MKQDIEQRLREALQQPFVSAQRFLDDIIFPVFGEDSFYPAGNLNVLKARQDLQHKANASGITSIRKVGDLLIEGSELGIFDITLDYKKQLQRNRVEVQQIIRTIISTHSGAFIIFHYESGARWEWRFTFCHKGASSVDSTDAKRYTYLLGPGQSCRTAAENFMKLHDKIENEGEFEMDDIIRAFDVEALSKEFFTKYKAHYERFCQYVYDHRHDPAVFGPFFATSEDKIIRDYVKKLLGRLVFLQFLQKKRWLGGQSCQWNDGDTDFLQHLFANASLALKQDFLDSVLEPLFQDALDTNRAATNQDFDTGVEGFRCCKIPYLNGGLFGKDKEIDEANSDFPAEYFQELFDFFYQYNFTIDENDPNDAEVGIDPEMLGRIFENLLEDNKDKGAFYTPKPIVQYMCRESLIAYLQNGCKSDRARQAARDFVETHDAEPLRQLRMEKPDGTVLSDSVLDFFDSMLRKVKICDPAIGSGAFPMGMLRELYDCRAAITGFDHATAAEIKKDIIQNNIYGVDIEKGAVDIARLRFWLTLILDEEDPKALPNLDFKIMQGNSLLEWFHGVDLSNVVTNTTKVKSRLSTRKGARLQQSLFFFDETQAIKDIQDSVRTYYATDNHSVKKLLLVKIEDAVRSFIKVRTEGRSDIQTEVDTLPLCNDQFFLWHTFFADVFANGGFDIVIGNPPYLLCQPSNTSEDLLEYYKSHFQVASYKIDLFHLFYEVGINILRTNGIISYITPNTFLTNKYIKTLRKFILNNSDIIKLVLHDKVFENAQVDNATIILRKNKTKGNQITIEKCERFVYSYLATKKQSDWESNKDYLFNVNSTSVIDFGKCVKLGSICSTYFGIQAFDKKRSTSDVKVDSSWEPIIDGGDVRPYQLSKAHKFFHYVDNEIKSGGDFKYYAKNRIVVRQIGNVPVAGLCRGGILCSNTIYSINTTNEEFSLLYIYAILCYKVTKYYWNCTNADNKALFPKIKGYQLKDIPIPCCSIKVQSMISTLVNQILKIKSEATSVDTSALEAEIDRIVYDLYELTEDEIRIIEGTNS